MSSDMWNTYFFDLCETVSKKSKDTSTKVGAVIVNSGHSIISTGYNGFPIGVNDSVSTRYERPDKYYWTAHAEENAIAFAARNGVSLKGATLYVNRMRPCTRCTRLIIQAGITSVFVLQDVSEATIERWKEDNTIADAMMKEAGVTIKIFNAKEAS